MRLSLSWLGELIDLPADDDLCHQLEMGGFEDVFVGSERKKIDSQQSRWRTARLASFGDWRGRCPTAPSRILP